MNVIVQIRTRKKFQVRQELSITIKWKILRNIGQILNWITEVCLRIY